MTETSRARRQSLIDAGEAVALAQQALGPFGEPVQAVEQRRRRAPGGERFDRAAAGGERVERNVDPVEVAVIVPAILQMIDDLQRGA